MRTAVISCRTIEDELTAAMKRTGSDLPVVWLESGLHNTPKKLNERLAEEISRLDCDRLLLAMGFCGNSLGGLTSPAAELIVPRVDDCISLLLGGVPQRLSVSSEYSAYFLTEGWLRGERNLWVEYQYTVEKYGEEQARLIAEMMYGHYRTLALLDTGLSDMSSLTERTREIADTFHMKQVTVPATLDRLCALLTGPWDAAHYLIVPPGESIGAGDMIPEH